MDSYITGVARDELQEGDLVKVTKVTTTTYEGRIMRSPQGTFWLLDDNGTGARIGFEPGQVTRDESSRTWDITTRAVVLDRPEPGRVHLHRDGITLRVEVDEP